MARKKNEAPALSVVVNPAPTFVEAAPRTDLRLDLGCGGAPKQGFEGVDKFATQARHKVDLFKFPWPFADNSVEEIHCSHFLEHVPAREIVPDDFASVESGNGGTVLPPLEIRKRFRGEDMLCAVMDECCRILKPECWMTAVVPSARSNRAFQDPTHRRFFVQESFFYFCREWRQIQGLDHGYLGSSNFAVAAVDHTMPNEEGLRSPEVQSARFHTLWNTTFDWIARLKKLP